MMLIFFIVLSYLLGSIPFGLLIGKYWIGIDIRTQGSGNIGSTNMMRVGGKVPGVLTFILDMGKGSLAVWIALIWLDGEGYSVESENALNLQYSLVGISVICGHVFPIFLKFKGGKGVATLFGVLAVLSFPVGIVTALVWIGIFLAKRISSLSALVSLVVMPFLFLLIPWVLGESTAFVQFIVFSGLSILLIYRHRENIVRLLNGEEGHSKAPHKTS